MNARTLKPNLPLQDQTKITRNRSESLAFGTMFTFRALEPCALQSSAFKTKDRALDHFSTPMMTRSAGGWSRGHCCRAQKHVTEGG